MQHRCFICSRHLGGHRGTKSVPQLLNTADSRGCGTLLRRIPGYILARRAVSVLESPKSQRIPHRRLRQPRISPAARHAPEPGVSGVRIARPLRFHRSTGGSSNAAPRDACSVSTAIITEWAAASSPSVGLPVTTRMATAAASGAWSADCPGAPPETCLGASPGKPPDAPLGTAPDACPVTAECSRASWAASWRACPSAHVAP